MLIRCALFVAHELIVWLLRASWFMYMKWHTCWFAVHSSWPWVDSRFAGTQQADKLWTWCIRFICDRVKTRVDGMPNPQLFSQAYQYVWQKNTVDKNLFQLLATELKNGEEEIVIKTRWSPRTRMLTRMLMVQMSKHMVMQSRTISFCNSLYLNSLVHVSLVTSLQCGVESVECGVWSVKWSKECGV